MSSVKLPSGKRRWSRPAFDPDTYGLPRCVVCGELTATEYAVLFEDEHPDHRDVIWTPLCLKCLREEKDVEQ